jgi:hypothetical protein
MQTDLTLDLIQSQLKPRQKLLVGEETIAEIQKLAEDPDYGPEFLDCYLDHLIILKENPSRNHNQYLHAMKFYSLVESGNSLTDAYIKTFPERWADRQRNRDSSKKDIMRGEASRYNGTLMVAEIRRVAAIPVQLIHRHLLHEAILVTAELMTTSKSDMVKQRAADTLIRELKPSEDQTINVEVKDGSRSVIDELRKVTEDLAVAQYKRVEAGVPLRELSKSAILQAEADEISNDET